MFFEAMGSEKYIITNFHINLSLMGLMSVFLLAIGTYVSLILLGIYQIKEGEVGLVK